MCVDWEIILRNERGKIFCHQQNDKKDNCILGGFKEVEPRFKNDGIRRR